MINYTPLLRPAFLYIASRRSRWSTPDGLERCQRAVLERLLHRARHTEAGRRYNFQQLKSYEDFARAVPAVCYEDISADIERMVQGEPDILWPGVTRRFAQSSGTSGAKSKYIPVTDDSLSLNHYRGGAEATASYMALYPDNRMFSGKNFILGGSFATEHAALPPGVRVGDLSANLIERINPLVNLFRIPDKKTALLADWSEKLEALVAKSADENVTGISGVPSWFLTVIRSVMAKKGASTIHDVWPNLEVFFHGGIAFGPYREQYAAVTDTSKMHYIENYNASEGFFAVQDTVDGSNGMLLLADAGVFYEFVPFDSTTGTTGTTVPAWKVEKGQVYEILITAPNGLWRYAPGDTVRIESIEPLRISIAGRTNSFINAFGEELMVWNADAAIAKACSRTGASVANYTAAPVYTGERTKGHHQWLIEWEKAPECGNEEFADILDAELRNVNSDYDAKRSGDIFLARLELTELPRGSFSLWLAATGKLGGQRKVPRLSNDRRVADAILKLTKR